MTGELSGGDGGIVGKPTDLVNDAVTPHYADELLPFDITITFE